jgi:signal transduction histidine kinase
MNPDRLLRHGWRSWLILYGAWTLPPLMISASVYAIQRAADQDPQLGMLLARQLWFYYLFASICPLVYRLGGRYPFARGRWMRALAAHVAAGMGVVVLAMMLTGVMEVVLGRHEGPVLAAIQRELTTPQGQVNGFVNLFNFVTVVGAMAIVRLSRQRRMHEDRAAELETQVARAHLRALEMQINPHFLFNALNGIASLVQQKRDGDAYRAITLLGGLLRETIDGTERKLIPLQQELAFLERYLELEHMRFSDRLRVSVRADQDCRDVRVPAMILQPIVENAIRHGISREAGAGRIEILAGKNAGNLALEVRDDGPGLPPGWTLENGVGVGLDNVRQRLRAHYGDAFELSLARPETGGVSVRILLPLESSE